MTVGKNFARNDEGRSTDVPVAIVGMACRLAGSATTPDALWQMLSRGKSGWSRGAASRFNQAAFYHPSSTMNGTFNAQGMHLLKQDISHFDNQMFNISAVEAKAIDPQQRLLLEVAYEAFENAGMITDDLTASETGVYSAVFNHDYESIQSRDPEISPSYRFTGTGPALVSNRISYVFDLRGPSITLDTACSGSLVAVHQAVQAIRAGEVRQALVGGTNLILDPEYMASMSSMQVLSDHGRCYAFDSRAGGFGRGEGVAAIVVKRLDDALRDGDNIRSIIRGSATNQDGKTAGITMPSHDAQVKVIRKAYTSAGLDPRHTTYVEAHGTGTKVGDKTEAGALAEAFGRTNSESSKLYIGSVKTNVGHTESTAGLAGLLKASLVLENGIIPPNLNYDKPNPTIPWEKYNLQVPQRCIKWPTDQIKRASVNSFGYGGSNAHVILDNADEYLRAHGLETDRKKQNQTGRKRLFLITHNTENGVGKLATDLKRYIAQKDPNDADFFDNLSHTLNSRRSKRLFRVAFTGTTQDEAIAGLEEIAKGISRPVRSLTEPKICFAFTGQGAQWAGMGKELSSAYPLFAQSLHEAEQALVKLGADWSLTSELTKPTKESRINEARISQPCCTAVQIALVKLLKSWNIQPNVVCGHSSGEIAAAFAAGFLTAEDAMAVSYHRGEAVQHLKTVASNLKGGMLAVGLSVSEAKRYLRQDSHGAADEKVVIACVNSPSSVTLSGDVTPLQDVKGRLDADGVFNRMLVVDVAYHSHHMDLVRERYITSMKNIKLSTTGNGVQMFSSVTLKPLSAGDVDAFYWADNMTSCVQFSDALQQAAQYGNSNKIGATADVVDIIAELGPHSALAGPIKQTLKKLPVDGSKVRYAAAVVRNTDSVVTALRFAGDLACAGVPVDLNTVNDSSQALQKALLVDLPTYNWDHTVSHWNEGRASSQYRLRKFPRHDLLGTPCSDSLPQEPKWQNYIRLNEMPWVRGHSFQGQMIFPASGYVCAAIEAIRQVTLESGRMWKNLRCRFQQIHIGIPLLIPEDTTGIQTLFVLRPSTYSDRQSSSNWKEFRMFSISESGDTVEHCRGQVKIEDNIAGETISNGIGQSDDANSPPTRIERLQKTCRRAMPPKRFYTELKSLGIDYTGPFSNITDILTGPNGALCTISVPETKSSMPAGFEQPYCIHPSTLDMFLHAPFTALRASGAMKGTLVISQIDHLDISSELKTIPLSSLLAGVAAETFGYLKYKAVVAVAEPEEISRPPLIEVKGLVYSSSRETSLSGLRPAGESLCHQIQWVMDPSTASTNDISALCSIEKAQNCATRRRDVYDAYAQKIRQDVFSRLSPEDELRMESHHQSLLAWMRAHSFVPKLRPEEYSRDVVESLGVDGKMLVRVGDHMVDILRGKTDPLAILLEGDLLYEVYSNENTHRCHDKLDKYLQLLKLKNPGMDILEIGAGTAGTTVPVLEAFSTIEGGIVTKPNINKYVFTDISSGFFEKSKEKLSSWAGILDFKKLDIESDPETQGFKKESFDLIIASNVLHATKSIEHTLRNVRKLLKPSGKLIMVEITDPHQTWHCIVGTLPGWWLGAAEGRVDSPSLSCAGWHKALLKTGYTGLDAELWDYESEYEHQLSVLISSAKVENPVSPQSINIISNDQSDPLIDILSDVVSASQHKLNVQHTSLRSFKESDDIHVVIQEAKSALVNLCDEKIFEDIKRLLTTAKNLLWVTRGAAVECENPERAMITGLARTARSEDHSLKLVTLDLDPNNDSKSEAAKYINQVLRLVFQQSGNNVSLPDFEFAVRDGVLKIPRIVDNPTAEHYVGNSVSKRNESDQPIRQDNRSLELQIATPGLLETFYWSDSKVHSQKPTAEEVRIRVTTMPLNFKDLMTAMGQLDGLTAMMIECGGVVEEVGPKVENIKRGDRVCALSNRSLATTSNVDYRLVHRIPDEMATEEAAAIQISYATALYSLRDVGRLQKGESVLIHSAAGGFGQAAIAISKYLGAGKIYVTVGSEDKKAFIIEKFGIPREHIFSSRNLGFKDKLLQLTKGDGVDVVVNSLSGEAMFDSYKCLARFGRFVEIGKKDLLTNTRLEMQPLEKNITLSTVDLSLLMEYKKQVMQELLSTVFELMANKKLEMLGPITTQSISNLEETLRQMQGGKHIGKFVMTLEDDAIVRAESPAEPLPTLDQGASYLIIGGTGGLGKAIIKHLTVLGAKHIITMSRSGAQDAEVQALVEEFQAIGVTVEVQKGSVLKLQDIESAVRAAGARRIRGVIQGAMVLKDTIISNMSYDQWSSVVTPKVQGTLNLHTVLGKDLDFFIMLSSGTGIIGSYGQGNYAAGNTFQDAFARWRTTQGLPARTIDLGPVEGEGYAAENEKALEFTLRQGMGVVKLEEVMALINHGIAHPKAENVAASQILAATRRVHPEAGTEEATIQRADLKFSHLWTSASNASQLIKSSGEFNFQEALRSATSLDVARDAAQTAIINKLAKLLAMTAEQISPESAVGSYGMDSLISVELRNWISTQLEANVQQFELMGAKSIQDLASTISQRSRLVPSSLVAAK